MIPETYSDDRLVQFVQVNAERLRSQNLGDVQRDFLKQTLAVAIDDLNARGIEVSGIYDNIAD